MLLLLVAYVSLYIIEFAAALWLIVKARQWYNGQYSSASRQRFQFRLSTCIMMMLVASILVWLNVQEWELLSSFYGFPYTYYKRSWSFSLFGGGSSHTEFRLDALI